MNIFLLFVGLFFSMFFVGFIVVETFFPNIRVIFKYPLYILISVLISTWSVYFFSLLFGFSTKSIIFVFFVFLILLPFALRNKKLSDFVPERKHYLGLLLSIVVFILFFISLLPAIFSYQSGYIVMSAVNWQDTAMHMGIIESISEGNFPPQAPYFSGHDLTYYYFSDFHSGIINHLYGSFFPKILVITNSIFALCFSLSIYALSYFLTKSTRASIFSILIGVFGGSLIWTKFISDLINLAIRSGLSASSYVNLLANSGYTIEYGKILAVAPISDYLLQNRPMMIGLPAVCIVTYLSIEGFWEKKKANLILVGIIIGLLSKFQLFALGVSLVVVAISMISGIKVNGFKNTLRLKLFTVIPLLFFTVLNVLSGENQVVVTLFMDNFRFGPWNLDHDYLWYIKFVLANFHLPFLISLFVLPLIILKKKKYLVISYCLFLVFFITPFSFYFTIYEGDMFKFFYFMLIFQTILTSWFLGKMFKVNILFKAIIVLLLILLTINGYLVLSWSFFNKYKAYSVEEVLAGYWIRKNTPRNSVFLTWPTVHSSVTQIAGRQRVLSYITWPYSHGFNAGEDTVFSRLYDVENFYKNISADKKLLLGKYKISYVYVGEEEERQNPEIVENLDSQNYLIKVYNSKNVKIYEVIK